jgi:hypothetical protein
MQSLAAASCAPTSALPSSSSNGVDQDGVVALFNACILGDLELVAELAARPDVTAHCVRHETLDTPLHVACAAGQLGIVIWLVRAGVDCNAQNAYGFTPLHNCVIAPFNVVAIARVLFRGGADAFIANRDGLIAGDLTESVSMRVALLDGGNLPAVRFRFSRPHLARIVGTRGERLWALQHRTYTVIKLPSRHSLSDEIVVRGPHSGIAAVKTFLVDFLVSDGANVGQVYHIPRPELPPRPKPLHRVSSSQWSDLEGAADDAASSVSSTPSSPGAPLGHHRRSLSQDLSASFEPDVRLADSASAPSVRRTTNQRTAVTVVSASSSSSSLSSSVLMVGAVECDDFDGELASIEEGTLKRTVPPEVSPAASPAAPGLSMSPQSGKKSKGDPSAQEEVPSPISSRNNSARSSRDDGQSPLNSSRGSVEQALPADVTAAAKPKPVLDTASPRRQISPRA